MGKKIFVSYKYADDQVKNLVEYKNSTVRDYVTEFEKKLDLDDNIYKGESDGEDLSALPDDIIWEKLKNRIYDSSVTIIFISPRMKDNEKLERNQWIPWEVSYSLKEISRKNKNGDLVTSRSNAMLAVVLPDVNNSYSYYLENKYCCENGCVLHHTNKLFTIINRNKFNFKKSDKSICNTGDIIWHGECSYIKAIRWSEFIVDYKKYIDDACLRQYNINNYEIYTKV